MITLRKAAFFVTVTTVWLFQTAQVAEAENLRHSNIKNVQRQIQTLPDLGYNPAPAPIVAPSFSNLPPVSIQKPKAPILIAPEVQQGNEQAVQPLVTQQAESIANLSPKTQNIISEIGSGIGSDKSAPEKIVIEAGGFEKKVEVADDEITNELQEVTVVEEVPAFEISISTDKEPAFSDFEALKKANRALDVEQYESAIVLYQSVLEKQPDNREAMFGLATAYQKAGRKNRAKDIYKQLIKKHPTFEPALNNLLALAASEAPERALEEFAIIEGRNPNFAGVYAQKAKIYREQLNLEYAITNLRRALSLEPENNTYRYDLAIIEDENQNYAAALQLYGELINAANEGKKIPADKALLVDRMAYISTL